MPNILYITDYKQSEVYGYSITDYLNDLVFYGLKELLGDKVVDSTQILSLYRENYNEDNASRIHGILSGVWLLDEDTSDRSQIVEKIQDKYFDLIIYGSIRRCKDYWDLVTKIYPKNRIVLLDGEDDTYVSEEHEEYLYFKRELNLSYKHKNLKPITFSWPTNLLASPTDDKTQLLATVIPGVKSTYIFNEQKEYYTDYQRSYFGLTFKKAGWDCMRHYEILGNYCLPFFPDLKDCPPDTLFNFPKDLVIQSNELVRSFNLRSYYSVLDETFEYTKRNLTTKAVAEYLLNSI